jgi:hypothetical protein
MVLKHVQGTLFLLSANRNKSLARPIAVDKP